MFQRLLLFAFLFFNSPGLSVAQTDLRREATFFQSRQTEFQAWLDFNDLGGVFQVEQMAVAPDKVWLLVGSGFSGVQKCDSLKAAWKQLQRAFYQQNGQFLHVALLEKLSFQLDLPLDSLEIRIGCSGSAFQVRIFGEREGERLTARFESTDDKSMGGGTIQIPVGEIGGSFKTGKATVGQADQTVDIVRIREEIGRYFHGIYHKKGTKYLWKARIDQSQTYSNELIYEVSHISGEVLKGQNFFEMHRIKVTLEELDGQLRVAWNFQAKYGGGLLSPPRNDSNDYHDLETSADHRYRFEKYQADLIRHFQDFLQQL